MTSNFVLTSVMQDRYQSSAQSCLTNNAIDYYNNYCSANFADASQELARSEKNLLREESAHGRGIGGAGFAARLAKIYADELQKRSQIIITGLKMAHADFGAPLEPKVDAQLKSVGAQSLRQQLDGLKGQFQRSLSRLGISANQPSNLDQQYPLHQVAVSNQISQYLWTLRNVPMKSPNLPIAATNVTINGSVGALLTGANSNAVVNQHWTAGECSSLVDALQELRDSVLAAADIPPSDKDHLVFEMQRVATELDAENPSKLKLITWLGGIATGIQAIGSLQPALEGVRAAARAIGLPL